VNDELERILNELLWATGIPLVRRRKRANSWLSLRLPEQMPPED